MNESNISGSAERVLAAFAHEEPDRTPLFEIFQPYHPIHWPICGRTVGTDMAMAWDARADGIDWNELVEAEAQAAFQVAKFFELDMVRLNDAMPRDYVRPVKIGPTNWTLDGVEYFLNQNTKLVELAHPADNDSYSLRIPEGEVIADIESWDPDAPLPPIEPNPVYLRVRELAEAEGIDWVYMSEIGAGTGVAFYPSFLLMWMLAEPELYLRWLDMQKLPALQHTKEIISQGHAVVAIGGDVSCDKGPFVSPELYREYILPVIKEHVDTIHGCGALAVYTSDGNHRQIKDDFFFASGIDGYKEVDKAAGMTFEWLIGEGIDRKVCIIGNMDARHTLCIGTPDEVSAEVRHCLDLGRRSPGGHILHASHSVHEDVKIENYVAAVAAYREYFGMEQLSFPHIRRMFDE